MFLRILKKDIKRKKTMNIIMLVFIILASMFVASGLNNVITIANGTNNKIVCHLDNPKVITGQAGVNQMLGNVAAPVMYMNHNFQVNIYFYTVIDGTTTYYKYQSRQGRNILPLRRSYRTFFDFNFQTIEGTGQGVVISSQATPFTVE